MPVVQNATPCILVVQNVMPCIFANSYQYLGRKCYLHIHEKNTLCGKVQLQGTGEWVRNCQVARRKKRMLLNSKSFGAFSAEPLSPADWLIPSHGSYSPSLHLQAYLVSPRRAPVRAVRHCKLYSKLYVKNTWR
jgi:hypothetical protein